jgi:hypothetical protein
MSKRTKSSFQHTGFTLGTAREEERVESLENVIWLDEAT